MKKSPHQDYSPLASRHDSQDLDQGSTGAPQTKPHSTQLKTSLGFCKGCICPQAGHVPSSPGSPSPLSVYNLRLHKANPNRTGPQLGLLPHFRPGLSCLSLTASAHHSVQHQAT